MLVWQCRWTLDLISDQLMAHPICDPWELTRFFGIPSVTLEDLQSRLRRLCILRGPVWQRVSGTESVLLLLLS